ncbi:MAG: hypothetical protein ABSB71_05020 [Candidatus Bathyarchaeia archaeon]
MDCSPTIRNTKGIDVLAVKGDCTVQIQVKTSSKWNIWMLTEKAENLKAKNLFYVFVNLREHNSPEYFVIPSEIVVEYVTRTYSQMLKEGCSASTPRKLPNPYGKDLLLEEFKNKWDFLDY